MDLKTLGDIKNLIRDRIEESLTIEYKRQLGSNTDIAKDISSFANTAGGSIIYGLCAKDKIPLDVTWVTGIGIEERIQNIVLTAILPIVEGIDVLRLANPQSTSEAIYVVKVPRSIEAPHMANNRYYRRRGSVSAPMDDIEVKSTMLGSGRTAALRFEISQNIELVERTLKLIEQVYVIPASWIVRLAAATIFGCRVSELEDIRIHLDGQNSSIYVLTRKSGIRKHQPIPRTLVPIFALGTEPMKGWKLQYILKSMCKKAEIELPEEAGWHAIRRRVVTAIYERTDAKDLPIINYFRWSTKQRHLSQLPTYVHFNTEESDRRILSQHPFVPMWEGIVPYLMEYHPEYSQSTLARQLYNEIISYNK